MIRGAALPNKRIIRVQAAAAAGNAAPEVRCAQLSGRTQGTAAAFRFARLLDSPAVRRQTDPALDTPARECLTVNTGLTDRLASAADLPWLQSWAAQLGLPAPRSRRVRSFMLLKDSQRIGYMAVRDEMIDSGRGREPILWIVSAFLIPSQRGQGLILKFSEILSRQYYQKGKVGCRVASGNTAMLRLMARGGWKKLHSTRRFIDFTLELDGPFRASRKS